MRLFSRSILAVEDDSEKLNESFTISRKISQKSSERTPIPLQAQGSCLSFPLREKMAESQMRGFLQAFHFPYLN
jgi:hypothetical protein